MTLEHRTGRGRRRAVAALAAIAVVTAGLGLAFNTAEAGSTVTPQSGPAGKVVRGTYRGQPQKLQTMLFQVDLNGKPSFMFCIDISTYIQFGVAYDEKSWDESSVPNLANIARVLAQTNATVTKDPVEIAAAQAAIWHFSDGFDLDVANPGNDPAVTTRYNALVSDANANPVANEPAGTLAVTPATKSAAQGQPIFYDVATTATAPISIELSDSAVTAHHADGSTCDLATAISSITGPGRICLTASGARSNVSMTLRTGAAPLSAGRVFIRPQRQKLIIGKAGAAQSAETVTASWTANGRPSVTVACPAGGVRFGTPATFTAQATDPDHDPLVLTWALNGTVLPDQTGAEITITPRRGDHLAVTVTDSAGQVASADVGCTGKNPPTVALVCPDRLVPGQQTTFTAVGDDPDGDALTYSWELNGTLLTSTNGPTLRTVVNAGDVLRVSATDGSGLVSNTVDASCIPPGADPTTTTVPTSQNRQPTVDLACPDDLTWGTPATFRANGADPDGDALTYRWSIDGKAVPGANGPTLDATVRRGQVVGVTAKDPDGAASAQATAACGGNERPTVDLACPTTVVYGEPTNFTAAGADADGDALSYLWRINGNKVADQTVSVATLVVKAGDRVNVTAIDTHGAASDSTTVQCAGTSRPFVTITCPAKLVYDEPFDFIANGVDPDGDTALVYSWYVNGTPVAGVTGPKLTTALSQGDVLTVTVMNSHGTVSSTAAADCGGDSRPVVALVCPEHLTFGSPVEFTATGTDADGDELTYEWKVDDVVVDGRTGPEATLTISRGARVTVTATDTAGVAATAATSTCDGTNPPAVETACPAQVVWGEPVTFEATGTDADGDTLAYAWAVNGEIVGGATGPTAELTLGPGDVVTVTATDATGRASATAAFDCSGARRPKLSLACPSDLDAGRPATFHAAVVDADDGPLAYTWALNGAVVRAATGPSLTVDLHADDQVAVTAVGLNGLVAATVGVTCQGTTFTPPPVPSTPAVLSSTVYHAATRAAVAAMPVTGSQTIVMVLIGLVALGAGLTIVGVTRRRDDRRQRSST